MIALLTDFGLKGPYLGQLRAVLQSRAPQVPVIDLMADLPAHDVKAAAYLLPALAAAMPPGTLFLCVVDPGVGGSRAPVIVRADSHRFVGPGNGLFELVRRRAKKTHCARILWRPENLSASFHGRDLFAPVAASLALGSDVECEDMPVSETARPDWPDDLAEVIYIDGFGNAITGLRAAGLPSGAMLGVAGQEIAAAPTFSAVPAGQAFWYKNSMGLAEIAVNRGRADQVLGLAPGARLEIPQRLG